MKQKKIVIILMISLAIILSGCDLYDQLYSDEQGSDDVTFVAIEDIKVADEEVIENDEVAQRVKEVQDKINENKNEEKPIDENLSQEKDLFPPEEKQEMIRDENAIVIIAQETELISLEPDAFDPDEDALEFFYTNPLDNKGTWATNYGDEGEYTVTITASDGTLSATQDVLLIINRKEESPTIDFTAPKELVLDVKENTELNFKIEASDLNDDSLTYNWLLDGKSVSSSKSFDYKIGFNDAGSHTIKVDVSDGTTTTNNLWSITVNNVNRKPQLDNIEDIIVKETQLVTIRPNAIDPDGDKLEFTISNPVGNSGEWTTTYNDAGKYIVEVTASDGTDTVTKKVNVEVTNVNRPPVITGITRK